VPTDPISTSISPNSRALSPAAPLALLADQEISPSSSSTAISQTYGFAPAPVMRPATALVLRVPHRGDKNLDTVTKVSEIFAASFTHEESLGHLIDEYA